MLKICIGYEPKEAVAYHVLCHSILRQASGPVTFIPIVKNSLPEYGRPIEDGSTEFSYTRFLTPYLCGFTGYCIFMDCDMLVRGDIYDILQHTSMFYDVSVVKHDYTPKHTTKFLGNKQTVYPKKNWSSVMVFNCGATKVRNLTPHAVSMNTGKWLHQFEWTNENRIGELPPEWNHLVGEQAPNPEARIIHFTLGTPCFKGYEHQEWSDAWHNERELMLHAD